MKKCKFLLEDDADTNEVDVYLVTNSNNEHDRVYLLSFTQEGIRLSQLCKKYLDERNIDTSFTQWEDCGRIKLVS